MNGLGNPLLGWDFRSDFSLLDPYQDFLPPSTCTLFLHAAYLCSPALWVSDSCHNST